MDELELKRIMIEVVENHFCCNSMGNDCEAGYCRPRLIRIENTQDAFTQYAARRLNQIARKLEITDDD
jgi:hypothetical protein